MKYQPRYNPDLEILDYPAYSTIIKKHTTILLIEEISKCRVWWIMMESCAVVIYLRSGELRKHNRSYAFIYTPAALGPPI